MPESIFPVAYFGSVNYYLQIVQSERVCFELFEHYIKQTIRNRAEILTPNGVKSLSIPVSKPDGNKTFLKDIRISYAEDWQKNHWKSIETAYSGSPYFDHYGIEVKELIFSKENILYLFNEAIHTRICSWLGLSEDFSYTSMYIPSYEEDFRMSFNAPDYTGAYTYTQVFASKENFHPNLSILDAVFNLGPMARNLLIPSVKSLNL